jgi:hypothetical protein
MNEYLEAPLKAAMVAMNNAYEAVLAAKDAMDTAAWDVAKDFGRNTVSEPAMTAMCSAAWNARAAAENALASAGKAVDAVNVLAAQYAKLCKTGGEQ